jgi:uncharacterized membrane protein YoaK (UPF0700 family)
VGTAFLAVAAVVVIVAAIGFWYLSRVAPRGVVLVVAVALYAVGVALALGESRAMHGISGSLKVAGFVGIILGILDLFRKRGSSAAARQNNVTALKSSLGATTKSTNKPR